MVRLSSLEADHSCGLSCPSSAVYAGGASCELTGVRVNEGSMPVAQLAPWTTRFPATEVNR